MSADPRAKALSALARFQVTQTTVGETLHRIAEITVEAIRPAAFAGITMLGEDGAPATAVYTDTLSPEACIDHGVLSSLSMGALNLYATEPRAFDAEAEAVGADLAGAAGAVLANVSAYRTAVELGQQLTEAMRSRAVIEQAKGMLMARTPELSPDDAFELLRRASQRENVKLRDIAQRIVDRKPPPTPTTERPSS